MSSYTSTPFRDYNDFYHYDELLHVMKRVGLDYLIVHNIGEFVFRVEQ
jgi:hypothetical protein